MSSKPKLNKFESFNADIFNAVNPVVGVKVYRNGVMIVKRESKLQGRPMNSDNGRKDREIMKFTPKSMSRLIATINATEIEFNSMLTLTYPALYPKNGKDVKKDLNRFVNLFRRKHKSEYLWFLEFQKRGAPHFHFLTEFDCVTPRMRMDVAEKWVSGIAKSDWIKGEAAKLSLHRGCGCEYDIQALNVSRAFKFTLRKETWERLRDKDGARKYVTKYATKEYQKEPPVSYTGVGRFWGCSSGVVMDELFYVEKTEKELRQFLSLQDHATCDWEVIPKYLFNLDNM